MKKGNEESAPSCAKDDSSFRGNCHPEAFEQPDSPSEPDNMGWSATQGGKSPSAFVEAAWRVCLDRDSHGGSPRQAAYDLIPAIVNSYGGWHPAFAQWWRGAVRMAAEHPGPTASQTGMV